MSLINQVLNDLDKRGASTNIGEATIRVVPLRRSQATFWWIFVLLSLALLLALVWHKWSNDIQLLFNDAPVALAAAPVAVPQQAASQPVVDAGAEAPAETAVAASAVPAPTYEATGTTAVVEKSGAVEKNGVAEKPLVAAKLPAVAKPAAKEKPAVTEKPVAMLAPEIVAVQPSPVAMAGMVQAITINGSHFANGATLILRTPKRNPFSHRQIVLQNEGQLIFNVDLSGRPGSWSVEVVNPSGHSSGQFAFTAQPEAVAAGSKAQRKPPLVASAPKTAVDAAKPVALALPKNGISKQLTQITPQQQAENEYRKAYALQQQGQLTAAISGFEAALQLDAGHAAARQTLVRLLLDSKRHADAERVLQEGLQHDPKQSNLALLLARMQVGRNELPQALETMEKSLPYAAKQADYQAFVAALLQRQNRHQEAIGFFRNAIQLNPQAGVWLMGLGISLRAEQRNAEARDAFNRALEVHNLSNELQSFVNQQLKEL